MSDAKIKNTRNTILIILGAAFVVRVLGIWYGLPALYNSDEPFNVVNALSYGAKKSLQPTYFVYPALYSYILFSIFGTYFLFGKIFGVFETALDFAATYFLNPTGLFLAGRFASVVLGVLTVWLVFKIGQRFFTRRTGLLTSVLLMLSFAHTDLSHWVLVESTVCLLTAWALYWIFRFNQDPTPKFTIFAGLVCGLAVSAKYNAGFIFVPFILVIILKFKNQLSKLILHLSLGFSALLFGFLAGSPYWALSFTKYWSVFQYTFSHVTSGMVGHVSTLPLIWPLWELIHSDWTVGVLLVAGLIYVLFQRDKKQLLLLLFALPTLLYLGTWQRTGVHYLLPIFPALVLLAAIFLEEVLKYFPKKNYQTAVLLLLLIAPLLKIVYQDIRLCQTDSRTFAKEWIEANISESSVIAYENYVYGPNLFDPGRFVNQSTESDLLPVELKERILKEKNLRTSYNLINLRKDFKLRNLPESPDQDSEYLRQLLEMRLPKLITLRRQGIEFILASSDNYMRYFQSPPPSKGTPVWLSYQNGKRFYSNLFSSQDLILLKEFQNSFWTLGPTIRIYQFKPEL